LENRKPLQIRGAAFSISKTALLWRVDALVFNQM
jgi:hypothetical protein